MKKMILLTVVLFIALCSVNAFASTVKQVPAPAGFPKILTYKVGLFEISNPKENWLGYKFVLQNTTSHKYSYRIYAFTKDGILMDSLAYDPSSYAKGAKVLTNTFPVDDKPDYIVFTHYAVESLQLDDVLKEMKK